MGTLRRIVQISARYVLLLSLPMITAVGEQLDVPLVAYFPIAATLFVVFWGAVAGKIPEKLFPLVLYSLSLSLIWSASLVGAHIIGSDMAGEFYTSYQVQQNGYWDPRGDYGTQSSTSFVTGWLVPTASRLSGVGLEWIYKVVLPALFAFVPTLLFIAYRRFLSSKVSLLASLFFLIVPVTTLEIVQISKSMVAEVGFAALVLLTVRPMSWRWQLPVLLLATLTSLWGHYTVGLAVIAYLSGILLLRILRLPWAKDTSALPASIIGISLLVSLTLGYGYYKDADGGSIVGVVSRVLPTYAGIAKDTVSDATQIGSVRDIYVDAPTGAFAKGNIDAPSPIIGNSEPLSKVSGYGDKFRRQESVVKAAVGLDFSTVSSWGKAFRVVQYLTQALVLIGSAGFLWGWTRRRANSKQTAEFTFGVACSLLLLFLVVFLPQFSLILNATRFYHLSLFFLAPMLPLGVCYLFQRATTRTVTITAAVLSLYFVFTSGLVFELTKQTNLDKIDTPYSIGLSAQRTGVVATYTTGDVSAAKWLAEETDPNIMIVGDYNGWHLVSAYAGLERLRDNQASYNPTLESLPEGREVYVFTTTWNNRHRKYVESLRGVWGGAGLREVRPLPDFSYYSVVYRSGEAVVYAKR